MWGSGKDRRSKTLGWGGDPAAVAAVRSVHTLKRYGNSTWLKVTRKSRTLMASERVSLLTSIVTSP